LESPRLLADFQILCIPGGFCYGDDIASGKILGVQLQHHLAGAMQEFKAAGKLILGICNGFQAMIKCGLLLDDDPVHGPPATLAWNVSGHLEDRWVRLTVDGDKCVFLAGIREIYLPIAHGEGRFVAHDEQTLAELNRHGQLCLRYSPLTATANTDAGAARDLGEPLVFPDNPNGAQANVAGLCDSTGRIFGLMPHPERHIDRTQHPRWTRGEGSEVGDGLRLFQNAVNYFR
jgi:phosphoribosylformylglycinamidine synthase